MVLRRVVSYFGDPGSLETVHIVLGDSKLLTQRSIQHNKGTKTAQISFAAVVYDHG